MKKALYSIALMMVAVFSSVLLTACGNPEPVKLEIVASSVESPTVVTRPHDLSGLKVIVTYDDGSKETVAKNNDMTITPINVNQLGTQTLTVKYLGLTATLPIEVVATEGDLYSIIGFDKPTFQTDWEFARLTHTNNDATPDFDETELNFADTTQTYKVGDENPFVYLPIITGINDEGDDVEILSYTSKVDVYELNGSAATKLEGSALTNVVAIDNTKSSFDFTQAAVTHKYRIVVEPAENPYEVSPLSIDVEVVDGFNVHNVAELSAMDNGAKTAEYWADYKAAHGITQTAQDGIVLHGNINLTANDIPKFYIYNYNPNGANEDGATAANNGSLKYRKTIYTRDAQTSFTIHGNYFTVDASKMPLSKDYILEEAFCHAYIFGFGGDNHHCPDTKQAAATVENLYMIGNANKDDHAELAGGINGIITSSENLTIRNVITRAFVTHVNTADSLACSADGNPLTYDVVTNVEKAHMYDSYNMMFFGWGNIEINITDSVLKRAGGPTVIIDQVVDRHIETEIVEGEGGEDEEVQVEKVDNIRAGQVNIKNTVLESYLAGTEGWFDLTPGAGTAVSEQIMPLGQYIHITTSSLSGFGVPVKTLIKTENGVPKLNLVTFMMSNADNPLASPYGLETVLNIVRTDSESGNDETLHNNDPNTKLAPIFVVNPAAAAMPFFEAGGVVMATDMDTFYVFVGAEMIDIKTLETLYGTDPAKAGAALTQFFGSDYMTLYMGGTGMAITLELFTTAPIVTE